MSGFNELSLEQQTIADQWAREILGWHGLTDAVENGVTVDDFDESFNGTFENVAEFVEEYFESNMDFQDVHSSLRGHIDWQGVWESEFRHYFTDIKTDDHRVHIFITC